MSDAVAAPPRTPGGSDTADGLDAAIDAVIRLVREIYDEPLAPIPLHAPRLGEAEKRMLCRVIDAGFVSSVGPEVAEFESALAATTGARHAIATVSGTAALHVALLLAGVGKGDEVITQPLSFVATCNAIHYCGAQPVFVDVEEESLGLDPDALSDFLSANAHRLDGYAVNIRSGRRIAACVPMHTLGHPCRIDRIVEICQRWGIPVVEDAAEALGSTRRGQHAGTFGRLGILSFNGNKIITTGGGGAILTDDADLAGLARHLTTTAKLPHAWQFDHDRPGFNYRMPNLNAALGLAQLERLPAIRQAKRRLAAMYDQHLRRHSVGVVWEPTGCASNYWLNSLRVADSAQRDRFLERTHAAGILTRPLWEPLHRLAPYRHGLAGPLPMAERLAATIVNLPSSAP